MPPKKKRGLDLPPGLYVTGKYYRWLDPRDGQYKGMGTDKESAIADAKALNAIIYASLAKPRVETLSSGNTDAPTLSTVIRRHVELHQTRLERGRIKINTMKARTTRSNALLRLLGDKPFSEIGVRDIAKAIATYVDAGSDRAAAAARTEAIEIWKTAMAEGWATHNLAASTFRVDVSVKQARLVLDSWLAIREAANGLAQWVGLSMDLAMVTGQRRVDLAAIEFKPREGASSWVDGNELFIIQAKTGSRVCLPLSLRLDALGLELGEVIARCRDNTVSRYLLHHRRSCGPTRAGAAIALNTITEQFAKARDIAAKDTALWDQAKMPPTFREQRSLSARLYAEQGIDPQALLGHRDAMTTAIYLDGRGAEWVRLKVG